MEIPDGAALTHQLSAPTITSVDLSFLELRSSRRDSGNKLLFTHLSKITARAFLGWSLSASRQQGFGFRRRLPPRSRAVKLGEPPQQNFRPVTQSRQFMSMPGPGLFLRNAILRHVRRFGRRYNGRLLRCCFFPCDLSA